MMDIDQQVYEIIKENNHIRLSDIAKKLDKRLGDIKNSIVNLRSSNKIKKTGMTYCTVYTDESNQKKMLSVLLIRFFYDCEEFDEEVILSQVPISKKNFKITLTNLKKFRLIEKSRNGWFFCIGIPSLQMEILILLSCLNLTISDISEMIGIEKDRAYRVVKSLLGSNYLEKIGNKYRISNEKRFSEIKKIANKTTDRDLIRFLKEGRTTNEIATFLGISRQAADIKVKNMKDVQKSHAPKNIKRQGNGRSATYIYSVIINKNEEII